VKCVEVLYAGNLARCVILRAVLHNIVSFTHFKFGMMAFDISYKLLLPATLRNFLFI
jgi:hypothetical protein